MRLYHGTNIEIKSIDLTQCRPYKDFGKGFYLTAIKEQSVKMAKRVASIYGHSPVINIYEIDENVFKNHELNIMNFGGVPTKEWALFAMNNRNREFKDASSPACNLDNKYDIVIGSVADDDMAMLFRQYQNELIDFETLINGMIYKKTNNQYSFHTERAVRFLQKVGVIYG